MTGAAGYDIGRPVIAELRQILRIEIIGHFDHDTRFVLDWICVGGEVDAPCLWVAGMAELTLDTQVNLVLAHDLDNFISRHVFRQRLEVGRTRARSSALASHLGLWGGSRRVLG